MLNLFIGSLVLGYVLTPIMGTLTIMLGFVAGVLGPWFAYFFTTGFMTAYYIPLLPYMIFTFGSIAWLVAAIESMVAAPIMALGVMTPEGEGIMGKSEQGFMILLNVFLRPSMMVIGFIMGIAMSYVSVWVLNVGFGHAATFLSTGQAGPSAMDFRNYNMVTLYGQAFFVSIYISLYSTVVQKSFDLISDLPDKVLRWVGGSQESYGGSTKEWLQEGKQLASDQAKSNQEGVEGGLSQSKSDYKSVMKGLAKQKKDKEKGSVKEGGKDGGDKGGGDKGGGDKGGGGGAAGGAEGK
jgi:defect-in-organelle-trafficking protein DotA